MPPASVAARLIPSEVVLMVGLCGTQAFMQASPARSSGSGTFGNHLALGLTQHEAEPHLGDLALCATRGVRDSGQNFPRPHHVDHVVNG